MSAFVLDCSVAATWFIGAERQEATASLLDRAVRSGAEVPQLFALELANLLAMSERRGRIMSDDVADAVRFIEELDLAVDALTARHATGETLALARRHGLTAYDSSYLELAIRRRLPLATLDRELRRAALSERVLLLPD